MIIMSYNEQILVFVLLGRFLRYCLDSFKVYKVSKRWGNNFFAEGVYVMLNGRNIRFYFL